MKQGIIIGVALAIILLLNMTFKRINMKENENKTKNTL